MQKDGVKVSILFHDLHDMFNHPSSDSQPTIRSKTSESHNVESSFWDTVLEWKIMLFWTFINIFSSEVTLIYLKMEMKNTPSTSDLNMLK